MHWSGWASFGFGATIALTGIMVFSQLIGLSRMDMPMMLGTMFVADPDRARVAGFLIHLVKRTGTISQIYAHFIPNWLFLGT